MTPATPQSIPLPPNGVRLFYWVRWRTWRAGLRALWHAPVKLGVIVVVWSTLLVGLYGLAWRGIRLIYETAGLGPFLMSRLWFLFLFVVMLMLLISQLTSAYATLVRAPETLWWATLPVSARTLGRAKWLESSCYSAWAVALLVLPLLLAYLTVLHRPWMMAAGALTMAVLPLLGITTALSTTLLLAWLRWGGRIVIRREVMVGTFLAVCAALFWTLGERHETRHEEVWFLAIQALLPRMQIAMSMWLPSSWAATVLDAMLNERWTDAALYTALLWSTTLLCWRLFDHVAARLLLPVLRRVGHTQASSASARRTHAPVLRAAWWARRPLWTLFAKDVLLVVRDPLQWSQAVVFFGLLGAYFANIHRLTEFSGEPSWRIGIASLNLACTLLVFGSLAVRFLFPQMSLESRNLWLLRIVPNGMRQLLVSKLLLYGTVGVVIIEGLLALSSMRLGVPVVVQWSLGGIGILAALTIVGMTIGFGALWIEPGAQDAARVVSSSSGALVLVLMLCYVACVVGVLVVVWLNAFNATSQGPLLAGAALLATSIGLGVIPVYRGLARLERLETSD